MDGRSDGQMPNRAGAGGGAGGLKNTAPGITKRVMKAIAGEIRVEANALWSGVAWSGVSPGPGTPIQPYQMNEQWLVLADDGLPRDMLQVAINPDRVGLIHATVSGEADKVDLVYFGPDYLPPRQWRLTTAA